jgi:SPP1 family phage portal protein
MTDTPIVATAINLDSIEPNPLKKLPIIEYYYNSVNMGAFEAVVPLLDALNNIMSNRADGIEQFIQSLAVATNCQFEEGTTANSIRQAGMIVLRSIGENKADFKILSEQLDQGQTQVLVDYIYEKVLSIVGMPSTTKGGASTSDTGAAVLARDGWNQAHMIARNTEDIFKESNRYFDEVFIEILKRKVGLNINISDFELQFTRNEMANVLAKAQAATTMLAAGFAPALAFGKSGVSNDPVQDVALSEKYLKMRWGDPDKPNSQGMENVELVEETRTDDMSGSI